MFRHVTAVCPHEIGMPSDAHNNHLSEEERMHVEASHTHATQ